MYSLNSFGKCRNIFARIYALMTPFGSRATEGVGIQLLLFISGIGVLILIKIQDPFLTTHNDFGNGIFNLYELEIIIMITNPVHTAN